MPYDLSEHRHRFAVWAAARAAQRGFTTVKNLREALEATDIRDVIAARPTRDLSARDFNALHRRWCSSIQTTLIERGVRNVSYGRAAKLVAVYLKTVVTMSDACNSSFGRNVHPPIDRTLLQALASSAKITSPHQTEWRLINWTQLEGPAYDRLVGQLRRAIPKGAPFWTIEEYWQPSNTEFKEG